MIGSSISKSDSSVILWTQLVTRWRALGRLSRESPALRVRIIHGSDYPFPPATLPYVGRVGWRPAERNNALDLDLRIKRSFDLGPGYASLILELMRLAVRD